MADIARRATASGRRIYYLLGAFMFFQIADGLLTHFLVRGGLGREGNPFLVPYVGQNIFLALKIGGAAFCALILWDISRRYPKVALIATSCFVALGAAIVLWNASLFFWARP